MTRLSQIGAVGLVVLTGGCTNLGYYWQSIGGQLEIWRRERPIEEVIADPATGEPLRQRLARVLEIREFATRELGLPDNHSYRSYANLGRPFVAWNVFAAPEFSVQPVRWCFLFAGCVSYRGYFSREEAERFAARLAGKGYDVYLGGVPAYSTLGWFPDPVLNTFLHLPEAEIARLIFHELAHQVAYAKDDTTFNESFAVTVEIEGVRRWLAKTADHRATNEFERGERVREAFGRLIERHRERLDALYRSGIAREAMREGKRRILRELVEEYRSLRQGWGGYAGYDGWFVADLNNAQLASVAIYTQLVPAFQALLARGGGDLARFYGAVKALAALPPEERAARLRALAPATGNRGPGLVADERGRIPVPLNREP
jgi:predicted aminopeptidase